MPRPRLPLKQKYGQIIGADLGELAAALRRKYPTWGRLQPAISQDPFWAVASVARHPDILAEKDFISREKNDFAECFKRYPDQVIEALRLVRLLMVQYERNLQHQRQKAERTQAGRVIKFLRNTTIVAKKNGELIAAEKLTPADYQPERQTLSSSVKILKVETLTDGEIAQVLHLPTASVTKARQSLARSLRVKSFKGKESKQG